MNQPQQSSTKSPTSPVGPRLDPAVQKFLDDLQASGAPPLYKVSPAEARKLLADAQSGDVKLPYVDQEDRVLPVGPSGETSVRIVRPAGMKEALPAIVYLHGGGWVVGDKDTHLRLISELAAETLAAVVFVDYDRSPEARYPAALEQSFAVAKYIAEHGKELNLDPLRIAVAGDSAGGNLAAAVTLLAQERGGPRLAAQVLFYPVTDARFDTASYREFAEGPLLTLAGMEWFWNAYLPDQAARSQPTVSPLQATTDQVRGLPPALVITAENDVLRDEGEAYAHKLSAAGVPVTAIRYLGTVHDFVLLNALADATASRSAVELAAASLRKLLA